jgi:hypothetical protein
MKWPERVSSLGDRLIQGVANQLGLMMLARRHPSILQDPRVFSVDNECVLDLETVSTEHGPSFERQQAKSSLYYGISLGGIMGTTYTALSRDIRASVISVPGVSISILYNFIKNKMNSKVQKRYRMIVLLNQ